MYETGVGVGVGVDVIQHTLTPSFNLNFLANNFTFHALESNEISSFFAGQWGERKLDTYLRAWLPLQPILLAFICQICQKRLASNQGSRLLLKTTISFSFQPLCRLSSFPFFRHLLIFRVFRFPRIFLVLSWNRFSAQFMETSGFSNNVNVTIDAELRHAEDIAHPGYRHGHHYLRQLRPQLQFLGLRRIPEVSR